MCQFIETIRVVDGVAMNLDYHQERMERTLRFLRSQWKCNLEMLFHSQNFHLKGIFKFRVLYNANQIVDISFTPYKVKKITSLIPVICDTIDYSYKSANRTTLEQLKSGLAESDEIIIVKKSLLTDTSYSNIALWDGLQWWTPKSPLLKGTMRQSLLDQGIIKERDILLKDLKSYRKISLINAMMPLGVCEMAI